MPLLNNTSEEILRKRTAATSTPTVRDEQNIVIPDFPDIEQHINNIWDKLRELDGLTTKAVKESELQFGRTHARVKQASLTGSIGQFRLKETSDLSTPNKIEICGQRSWQTLAARLPDLTAYKVVQYEEGSEGTDAEQILDLRTKLDGLITALSAANIFKLEDIPDENPNLDRDTAGLDWSQPPE